jgi:hypothetical protein
VVEPEEVTVSKIALEVLAAWVESPPYVAVIESAPAVLKEVLRVAPPELRVPVPSAVLPL